MAESEGIKHVLHEMQNFQRDFPKMAKEISEVLDRVWPLGMATTVEREDEIRYRMAKDKLRGTVCALQAAMVSLGHAAKSALAEGDLSPKEQGVCEVLYEIFVPERDSSS